MSTVNLQIDHGHIFELDSSAVCSRVLMKGSDGSSAGASVGGASSGSGKEQVRDVINSNSFAR